MPCVDLRCGPWGVDPMSRGAERTKDVPESADRPLLDLIRRRGPVTVAEMAVALGVTPTAIRNRLTRLVGSGLVERRAQHGGPGPPQHTHQAKAPAHPRVGAK